jgi:hypothetical protein
MWVGGFCPHWGTIKKNYCILKDVSSFISNSIRPSKSTQQWGLKPPKEELGKVEIISYNEG